MRSKGSTLALTVAVVFVVIIIGLGALLMTQLFGGARELQALTDAGTLGLGKNMITVGVPLNQASQQITYQYMTNPFTAWPWNNAATANVTLNNGIEGTNFAYLTDVNGNINLQNYNRVIAQTMLVGFNAQAEGTPTAAANAQTLYNAVQPTIDSLSGRLVVGLNDTTQPTSIFLNTAARNSMRMLGQAANVNFLPAQYATSYNSPGDCTNVWLDPSILPGITMPAGTLSTTQVGPTNQPYLTGYTSIETGPFTIQGTPVFPGRQPHLISLRDFAAGVTPPLASGYVAPNSFQASGAAVDGQFSAPNVTDNSASVVGLLGTPYAASIPEGYIVITNEAGFSGTLTQLFSNLNAADQSAVTIALTARLRQISPNWNTTQVQNFMSSTIVSPATTPMYIYMYPDPTSPLYTNWHNQLISSGLPDGTPGQPFATRLKPPTFPNSFIDPTFGMIPDGYLQIYTSNPGYLVKWQPSSGFNNLMAMLDIP